MAVRESTSFAAPDPIASGVRDTIVLYQGYVVERRPGLLVTEVDMCW